MSLSVAGALVELKLLDKRIDKAITSGMFVSHREGNDLPNGYKTLDELETKIKSSEQSVLDLIERRNKIKSAIVVSNATTTVAVGGVNMTVAEAIERKSSIDYERELLMEYKRQLANNLRMVDGINKDVERRADAMVQTYLGNDKSKADEAETIRKNFIESKVATLVDVLDIKSKIEQLEESIDIFESEVDLVLSTSNAVTMLEL